MILVMLPAPPKVQLPGNEGEQFAHALACVRLTERNFLATVRNASSISGEKLSQKALLQSLGKKRVLNLVRPARFSDCSLGACLRAKMNQTRVMRCHAKCIMVRDEVKVKKVGGRASTHAGTCIFPRALRT